MAGRHSLHAGRSRSPEENAGTRKQVATFDLQPGAQGFICRFILMGNLINNTFPHGQQNPAWHQRCAQQAA